MKQHVTKFEKNSSKPIAFLLLGLGLATMAVYVGMLDEANSTIAYAGAGLLALAGVLGFVAEGKPVASGLDSVEVPDNVQVQMSDELIGDIKSKVDEAIAAMMAKNEDSLAKAATSAETQIGKSASDADAAVSKVSTTADSVFTKLNEVVDQLQGLNATTIVDNFREIARTVDPASTAEALDTLKSASSSATSSLGDLATASSSGTESIERTVSEISENLEATKTELNAKIAEIKQTLADFSEELDKTLGQFKGFNA